MRGARLLSVGLALLLLGLAPYVYSSYFLVLLTQAVISAMLAMSLDLHPAGGAACVVGPAGGGLCACAIPWPHCALVGA
jgi:hypothetical protein